MTRDRDYEVGYRRPPRHTRFQKGRSGNPKGRPRKSIDDPPGEDIATIVRRVLSEPMNVTLNGRTLRLTVEEALVRKTTAKALAGDLRAFRLLQEYGGPTPSFEADGPADIELSDDFCAELIERHLAERGAVDDDGSGETPGEVAGDG